jgi:hypothetical protein
MKKISMLFGAFLLSCALSLPVQAETTVTVDGNDSVTVNPNDSGTAVVTTGAGTRTVVVRETPVIIAAEQNPRDFEGEIVKVETPRNATDNRHGEIVVRDTFGRDRRVQIKQGMIGNYKVGDYVEIHLMADLKEAKDIHTVKRTPDFEGTVVSVDTPSNVIIVRDSRSQDRTVQIVPDLITTYKVGDRVRLYEVAYRDYQPPRTVQVLR